MTIGRVSHTATLLDDGRVLIAGGYIFSDGKFSGTSSAELYDPSTGTFTATGHMITVRVYHTATLLPDGKVLIAGGLDGESHLLATAELYDSHTGTFTTTGEMIVALGVPTQPWEPGGLMATLLRNGKVLITGGWDRASHTVATGELYEPATGTFTATGDMAAPYVLRSYEPTGSAMPTLLTDGRVLITFESDAELYDPSTGTFTATGHMTTGRFDHTATLLPDGKVLIAGGENDDSGALGNAELFDPATGTFARTGDMDSEWSQYPFGRSMQTSTLLSDGTVLIAGGWPWPGNCWTSARLYDRLAGTFSAPGGMATGRCLHTATLLNDGSVLIAGGIENYDSFFWPLRPQVPRPKFQPLSGASS
jgi:WD40 repeat protein